MLFNPATYDASHLDPRSREQMLALVQFFESKGKEQMKSEYHSGVWYDDFLEFVGREGIFASCGTPSAVGQLLGGETGADTARWDTARINDLNEILAFYSLAHWYAWQVTVLGLGPIWSSDNDTVKAEVGKLLEQGAIFGFGLSEKEHGADIYSTDMILTPDGQGGWTATGGKYYIGNGNIAGRLSVFGKFSDTDDYVFFAVDTQHPSYTLVKNVVHSQMYVSEFHLDSYPVRPEDVLHTGTAAWDAALAAVNVGKVNLGWASIGICEHSFYEAITHANNRVLYGKRVTEFPHVRRMLGDAYARLLAMKLYAARSADYFRSASADDRRFLLYNPITKMKVTTEGERTVDLLWEVIAARGFEKDTYFERAAAEIRALPKLEGTVHVNLALVLKFLPAYLGAAAGHAGEYEDVPVRLDHSDDAYLFSQGPAKGLSRIQFPDWRPAFARFGHLPNVARFLEQVAALSELVVTAPPSGEQQKDLDFLLSLGQLFTQVVYAQLIAEGAALALDGAPNGTRSGSVSACEGLTEHHVDRMFGLFVRDVSEYAVNLHGQASASAGQRAGALRLVAAPVVDPEQESAFVDEVLGYDSAYQMRP